MRVATWNTTYLLYTALALVTLSASQPSFASPQAECDFAALVRLRSVADDFKTMHLRTDFQAPADNEAFLNRVIHDMNEGRSIYFHVDNAVLKVLNDKIFKDKELSAATLNLYKTIFFEELEKDRWLRSHIPPGSSGGVYSDFKTIRLAAVPREEADIEKIYSAFEKLHERVGLRFAAEMTRHPELEDLYRDRRGILGDPANWNQAGFGRTAAQASVQARRNRRAAPGEEREIGKPTAPKRFDGKTVLEVAAQIREIEKLRGEIDETFKHDPRVIAEGVFTPDAIDILRRAQGDPRIEDLADYRAYVEQRFRTRFGIEISDKDADRLQRYFHLANEMAPSIFIKEQEPIALAELKNASHGVVSFDISGQNGLNMRANMLALHHATLVHGADNKHDLKLVDLALELGFEGQLRESDAFDASKTAIANSLQRTHIPGEGTNTAARDDGSLTASGDDATFLPTRPIGLVEKMRLLRNLREAWKPASRFRVTFQPQTYAGGKEAIDDARRFELISQAEQVEKKLRDDLELAGFSYEVLRETIFGISVNPTREGTVKVDIFFAGSPSREKASRPALIDPIRQALRSGLPAHFELNRIYDADGIFASQP